VNITETLVEQNATMVEIEEKLFSICEKLETPYSDYCLMAVASETPRIIAMLEWDETAPVICEQIGLCPSSPRQSFNY
jgi:hypothetical protein